MLRNSTIEYENFEIELSRCCCGNREVRILDSPVDRPRESLLVGAADLQDLQHTIDRYDRLLLKSSHQAQARELAKSIGIRLFTMLTPGAVGTSIREALHLLDRAREKHNVGRRFRLSFGQSESYDPEIATLPWELICDPRGGERFLSCEKQTQVARFLDISRKIKPLAVRPPLKIIAVLASPIDQNPIDIAKQELLLRRETQSADKNLELHVLQIPTLKALKDTLSQHELEGRPFHVLHFLGHGELMDDGHGALYFEKDDRSQHVIRSQVLAAQISGFRDLRLVVLTTCSGARLPRRRGQNAFTGCASALIAANIPAVVAMQFNISAEAAAAFSSAFYANLGAMCPVEEAVAEGRLSILSADVDGCEWATPVLFLRSPDGNIFYRWSSANEQISRKPPLGDHVRVSVRDSNLRADRDIDLAGRKGPPQGKDPNASSTQVGVENVSFNSKRDIRITGTSSK